MDFAFNEEQAAVRELARQIFADHSGHERLREIERSADGIDRELWETLAKSNLLGISLPEEHGGSNMGSSELTILLEEQGRGVAQVPILASIVLGAMPIAEFGSEAQRARLLPGAIRGETILSAALSEHASFDPALPRVSAKPDGAAWRLDGEKICVPVAHLADRILVPARTGGDRIGVFLLDPTATGVTIERQQMTNYEPQSRLELANARVGADDVLGDPGAGERIVRFIEARAMLSACATMLGVAEEALRRTAEYTGIRKQFGKPIGSFQGVSLRAADGYIDVEAMRSTVWQAVWKLDEGLPAELEIAVARWWGCTGGHRVVHTAQHLHGGIGADTDYPIHRFLLWAKQLDSALGGATRQLAKIGELIAAGA